MLCAGAKDCFYHSVQIGSVQRRLHVPPPHSPGVSACDCEAISKQKLRHLPMTCSLLLASCISRMRSCKGPSAAGDEAASEHRFIHLWLMCVIIDEQDTIHKCYGILA